MEEPSGCFVLEVHWSTFGALVGTWRLKVLDIRTLKVYWCTFQGCKCRFEGFYLMHLSGDLSWLNEVVHL